MTQQSHMTDANSDPDPDVMFKMLKDLLNQDIKSPIDVQYQAWEKMITQKLLTMLNTQTLNQDRVKEDLRQDNLNLHNQVQDLKRVLRSTITVRTPMTWTPAGTIVNTPSTLDMRVAEGAVEGPTS